MKTKAPIAVTLLVFMALPVSATVAIDYVSVGNAGNAADTTLWGAPTYGAVAYEYQISKYEVTNAQYAEFLNAKGESNSNGIYHTNMEYCGITQSGDSGSYTYNVTGALANRPVVYVSWYDAARFANWLVNGQGSGDMETGAYTLSGNTGIITANAGAQVYIPTEDEWYKAAYFNGATSTYSLYPNGQNSITTADANYSMSVGASTDVGTYSDDPSYYGTFDQGGNVWEWNDGVIYADVRGLRGGSWAGYDVYFSALGLGSGYRDYAVPSYEDHNMGFRVASIASVPEPSGFVLTFLASGVLLSRRKR